VGRVEAGEDGQGVNPVRNSSGALNPARGGTPYGAEPGIILKSNPLLPPAQAPPKRGFCPGGRASRFRVEASGPEGAAGHYF